ncbi:MAG: 16S rRNA (uracil(1498)-N(3))-methyltransferase [Clostridia bacterium]|nr:16S rRNA (uracil(1498)-N(3))-methyltransferase [Clostridia bacterium]
MSEKKRFFVKEITDNEVTLTGEEFAHARTVLRLNVGSEIILLDNSGREYDGVVSSVEKRQMTVHIIGSYLGEREPNTEVKLLFGYVKNADKNEFVVQKATELGVKEIALFSSEYSSAYVNENKLERLKKIAQESAKQCLRSCAPEITYYPTLQSALESAKDCQNKLFACEFFRSDGSDGNALKDLRGSCALVVGSEGGFSHAEFDLAKSLGYQGVSLGKRILRAETAAVALTSVVMYQLGELQ